MSESIFETFTDERGNISVRVSQEVQVLTREEANRIEAEYRRMQAENAKLREQMERLVTLLRVDCDIDASWDGLRRFWSIGLTEDGCLMRDRACKAEAENAKLLELVEDMLDCIQIRAAFGRPPTEEMYEMFYKRARELGVDE